MEKKSIFEVNVCDISRLLEKTYGREFNIPYAIMESDNMILVHVSKEAADQTTIEDFQKNGYQVEDLHATFECLLDDLCFKAKLEPGEYLMRFDD